MKRIKVTGYVEIEDNDYDDGPLGPLTNEADEAIRGMTRGHDLSNLSVSTLEDLEFELADD